MFSHVFIGVGEFDRALRFYRALMPALGARERFCDRSTTRTITARTSGIPRATSCAWCVTRRRFPMRVPCKDRNDHALRGQGGIRRVRFAMRATLSGLPESR